MIDARAGVCLRGRGLLVLLVCLVLALGGGCSSDPGCLAAPYLPQCFDDDEEKKTEDIGTQTSVRVPARADDSDTTMAALRSPLVGADGTTLGERSRHRNERRLSLSVLRNAGVHGDDGGPLRVAGVSWALHACLEASSAAGARLEADRRHLDQRAPAAGATSGGTGCRRRCPV